MGQSLTTFLQPLHKRISRNGCPNSLHPFLLIQLGVCLDAIVGMMSHHHTTIWHSLARLDSGTTNLFTQTNLKDMLKADKILFDHSSMWCRDVAYTSLGVRTVANLQVDQWNNATRFLVTRRLEIVEAIVSENEPTLPPTFVLPSCRVEYQWSARGKEMAELGTYTHTFFSQVALMVWVKEHLCQLISIVMILEGTLFDGIIVTLKETHTTKVQQQVTTCTCTSETAAVNISHCWC